MAVTFTRTGAQIEDIHNTVDDPKSNSQFSDDIRTIAGEYRGLWPGTGGSANKGDTYQTQVSSTGTGQYFTALQNTTADPVGDDVNWRSILTIPSLGVLTNYQVASVADMIAGDFSIGNTVITNKYNVDVVCQWLIVSNLGGDFGVNINNGLFAKLVYDPITVTLQHFGASDALESSQAIIDSLNHSGTIRTSQKVLTDPFTYSDLSSKITVEVQGDGFISLQDYGVAELGYGSYFTDSDIQLQLKEIDIHSLAIGYEGADPATVGGVALSTEAEVINLRSASFGYLKVGFNASEYLSIDRAKFINSTAGSTKTANANMLLRVSESMSHFSVTKCYASAWPTDGNNEDIIKISGDIDVNMHTIYSKNTIINNNQDAGAQVDVYTGAKAGQFSGNVFINTTVVRKNTRAAGSVVSVTGTGFARNTFLFNSGFWTPTSSPSCALLLSGGETSAANCDFFIDTYLTQGVIFLDSGADDTPEQTSDLTRIQGCNVYADNAQESGNQTEYFVRRGTPQTGYLGQVIIDTCMVSGLERFANLLKDNDSQVSNCIWRNGNPQGTALSANSVTSFTSDSEFSYDAFIGTDVIRGLKIEQFETASASVDVRYRSIVMFNAAGPTVTGFANYKMNEQLTVVVTTSTPITFNLDGAASVTINQYEQATFTPYRVNNGSTVRWARSS